MKKLIDYAQHNLDNVSVGVTAGLKAHKKGIGIEFTIQQKGQRWGFRLRQGKGNKSCLFHVTEQRPGLFHYGLRGSYGKNGSHRTKIFPHPLTLKEVAEQWPVDFWPEGLKLLENLAAVSKH